MNSASTRLACEAASSFSDSSAAHRALRRQVQISIDHFERAVDVVLVDDALDLMDGGASGIPGLRM